jgi:hypothetical protein
LLINKIVLLTGLSDSFKLQNKACVTALDIECYGFDLGHILNYPLQLFLDQCDTCVSRKKGAEDETA